LSISSEFRWFVGWHRWRAKTPVEADCMAPRDDLVDDNEDAYLSR